jgi:ATP-dependent Clp protease ATP-binding subunit ClpA
VLDRTPPKIPRIDGTVAAPSAAATVDPDEMAAFLGSRVIGQDLVARQLARGIYRRMAQARRGKPVFTVLVSGPTGTGKTEMAKAIAAYLFGDENRMFRVDCANVLGEAGLQTLIGSPKGFAGSGSWGALTSHLRAVPERCCCSMRSRRRCRRRRRRWPSYSCPCSTKASVPNRATAPR